jgi:succinate dehydrogenase / fumarate reductase cytochrome b subunit
MNSLLSTLSRFYASSVGKKIVVAVTGLLLALFLVGHLAGNLLIFVGPEAINEYGHMLHTAGHGGLVWVARLGLLAMIVVHVAATIQLTKLNREARGPEKYGNEATRVASQSSRWMIYSGLTVLAFVIYHLMHFTVRVGNEYNSPELYQYTLKTGEVVHNVYKMVIDGFSWAPASAFYILAMVLLASHLSHGFGSLFQTLGLVTPKTKALFQQLGRGFALFIMVGNCSIPIAIWLFHYGR